MLRRLSTEVQARHTDAAIKAAEGKLSTRLIEELALWVAEAEVDSRYKRFIERYGLVRLAEYLLSMRGEPK